MEIIQIYAFAVLFIPEKSLIIKRNLSMQEVITGNYRYASLSDWDVLRNTSLSDFFIVRTCTYTNLDSIAQCFSTFLRPRPGKFFFHKTRARSQQIYSSVPFQFFSSSYIKLT